MAPLHHRGALAGESQPHTLGLILVAAGRGERFGGDKVWTLLGDEPLVARSLAALGRAPVEQVALVVAPTHLAEGHELARGTAVPCVVVPGGARRQDSVRNGLLALGPCEWVAVHDAARPFATRDLLARTLAAAQASGAAIPAVPLVDTVKRVQDGFVVETIPRAALWAVQTPQVFRGALLARAHREVTEDVTDDAAMVERLGARVAVTHGAYNNVKLTTAEDLALAVWRLQCAEG
jgi:2-C-methyl-D-erythritol 4-phosphate cytidylyltransferase